MPQNTYYSADEYYIDENSSDERSSQASDHSSKHEEHKCRKCRRQSPPPPRPREKCNVCKEPKREKCNKCGKSHRHSERRSKCERPSKSDCKCKYEKKRSDCEKPEKVIHDDCGKCIVIKIRPCKQYITVLCTNIQLMLILVSHCTFAQHIQSRIIITEIYLV